MYLYAYIINTCSNYIPITCTTGRRKRINTNNIGLAVKRTLKKTKVGLWVRIPLGSLMYL